MTVTTAQQHVILCEGYDDRSFWAGWLTHLGCVDPSAGGRVAVNDGWGRPVRGGRFLFEAAAGSKILVQPYRGKPQLARAVREFLKGQVDPPSRLIINRDSDAQAGEPSTALESVGDLVAGYGAEPIADEVHSFRLGATIIDSVIWETDEAGDLEGVPSQQNLERLVTASIQAAFDGRGRALHRWLRAEPLGSISAKAHSYSYLAKWYAEFGADDFFRALWRDEAVVAQLKRRLARSGAWKTVERLVAS